MPLGVLLDADMWTELERHWFMSLADCAAHYHVSEAARMRRSGSTASRPTRAVSSDSPSLGQNCRDLQPDDEGRADHCRHGLRDQPQQRQGHPAPMATACGALVVQAELVESRHVFPTPAVIIQQAKH